MMALDNRDVVTMIDGIREEFGHILGEHAALLSEPDGIATVIAMLEDGLLPGQKGI